MMTEFQNKKTKGHKFWKKVSIKVLHTI